MWLMLIMLTCSASACQERYTKILGLLCLALCQAVDLWRVRIAGLLQFA